MLIYSVITEISQVLCGLTDSRMKWPVKCQFYQTTCYLSAKVMGSLPCLITREGEGDEGGGCVCPCVGVEEGRRGQAG